MTKSANLQQNWLENFSRNRTTEWERWRKTQNLKSGKEREGGRDRTMKERARKSLKIGEKFVHKAVFQVYSATFVNFDVFYYKRCVYWRIYLFFLSKKSCGATTIRFEDGIWVYVKWEYIAHTFLFFIRIFCIQRCLTYEMIKSTQKSKRIGEFMIQLQNRDETTIKRASTNNNNRNMTTGERAGHEESERERDWESNFVWDSKMTFECHFDSKITIDRRRVRERIENSFVRPTFSIDSLKTRADKTGINWRSETNRQQICVERAQEEQN